MSDLGIGHIVGYLVKSDRDLDHEAEIRATVADIQEAQREAEFSPEVPCLSETDSCYRLLPCPAKEQWLMMDPKRQETKVEWLADRCRELRERGRK